MTVRRSKKLFGQMTKWAAEIDDAARASEYVSRATQPPGRSVPEDMLRDRAPSVEITAAHINEAHPGTDAWKNCATVWRIPDNCWR